MYMNINKLLKYDEYILESLSLDTLRLIISKRFKRVLLSMNNEIASNIVITSEFDSSSEFKITYLDIDDRDEEVRDKIMFMQSNKVIDISAEKEWSDFDRKKEKNEEIIKLVKNGAYTNQERFFNKSSSSTTVGRIARKLFGDKYTLPQYEEFTNVYKAKRKSLDKIEFQIVDGNDIQYWYNGVNYTNGKGSLNKSCMRHKGNRPFLDFYVKNKGKVSMLILKDEDDNTKIKGRAILWHTDTPSNRIFMDRIYTVNDADVNLFKDYAKEKSWIYKDFQNMSNDGPFTDTSNDIKYDGDFIMNDIINTGEGHYPYMDTLKYISGTILSNKMNCAMDSDFKILEGTNGHSSNLDGNDFIIWSDFYNEYINIEDGSYSYCEWSDAHFLSNDCYYSNHYDIMISYDYTNKVMVELDNYDKGDGYDGPDMYAETDDYITTYEGNTCFEEYAKKHFNWSDIDNEWLEDAKYSDHEGTYIPTDKAVEVYIKADKSETDWRYDEDGEWWEYKGNKYCDEITKKDLI